MNWKKRLAEIRARKAELRKQMNEDENANMEEIEKEVRALDEEQQGIERRQTLAEKLNSNILDGVPMSNPMQQREKQFTVDTVAQAPEYRSAYLKTLQGKPLSEVEQRAYSTAAESALPIIPESTANAIIRKMYEIAPILEHCKIFHVPGDFKFAVEDVVSDAELHEENAGVAVSQDKLAEVRLHGYEIAKLVKASRASTQMALSAFESYVVEVSAEYVAKKLENLIFTSDGNNKPGGVAQGGKGAGGEYTDGVDQATIGAGATVTEADVTNVYGMLGSGYERNAVWTMSKVTFFAYFYTLMNKSKNNLIEFANGKYYIMGAEVYFTGSLSKGIVYFGDFQYIVGNFSQDITVVKSEHSGLATNSIDYLGACVFDSKAIPGLGAFVKLVKEQS